MRNRRRRVAPVALLALALAAIGFAGPAQAKLVKEFTKFQYCPYTNAEVAKCLYSVTEGGEVKLGKKAVPITNKVLLQGGFGKPNKETKISKFFGATGGKPTLQPVAQSVPGGLAGVVPDASSPWLVKRLIKFFFENSLTGLNSTLELAGPATNIEISEQNMNRKEKVGLKLPVKVHLENPFLGSKCYIGSDSNPVVWSLTTGPTAPKSPNTPIEGSFGQASFLEEGLMLHVVENKLVDNNWSAPGVTGCGGILAFLVNPIVSSQLGTTTAGNNTAILKNTIDIATAAAVKFIDESNP
jgi:hypothetical protein